jgi:hypothetical protein
MLDLEARVRKIEERNRNVELGKEWETSWARRLVLMGLTYLTLGIYMWAIDLPRPWLNAIVPAIGFMISTLTMPWFKSLWLKFRK